MKLLQYLLILLMLFTAAATASAQHIRDSVIVLPLKVAIPADARKLGTIKAGNNATKVHCDYEEVIRSAKEQARAMGGNLVKITELTPPAFVSKCYGIKADVYAATDISSYHPTPEWSIANGNTSFASLCIYRLKDTLAFQGAYNIHLNTDSVVCRIKAKSADTVKIYKDGPVTLWASTEQRTELKLDVHTGNTNYIRCGLIKGELRMVPVLELIDKATGAAEFSKLHKTTSDVNVNYLQQIH